MFITQVVDPTHPVLAATVPKIAALAALASEVTVLARRGDASSLPSNCELRTFGARSRAARGLRFETALARALGRRPPPAIVLAHMCPIYAVLAAPLARPLGVPVALWFAHWRATPTLRAAERLSTAVLSVERGSFPLPSQKVRAIGHGIDVAEFACAERNPQAAVSALALGRYSPAKGLEAIVRAVGLARDRGMDVRLDVRGPALAPLEERHRAHLAALVAELGLGEHVRLEAAVAPREVPALFARHDVLVNNMRPGAADKVVYEAGASCLPVLASGPAFETLLDDAFRFTTDDAAGLAERLQAFAALDGEARARVGRALRERVVERHSVTRWAEQALAAGSGR